MYGKQMELFEDGGEVDPVSGNDIPLGSTAEEVRDDQPAMLSEGEMVVPADVVRYFGVEFFMDLRDKAKMGYKKMEAMGQFGTEDGQTLPDDTLFNAGGPPFTIEDIEVLEDYEEDEPIEKKNIEAADGALVLDNLPVFLSGLGTLDALRDTFSSSSSSGTSNSSSESNLKNLGSKVAFSAKDAQGIMGTNIFEYLKSFLPPSLLDDSSEEDQQALSNYGANIERNINTALGNANVDTGGESAQGDSLSSKTGGGTSPTPGTGDIHTLMSYPTTANIAGLQSFGNLLNSDLGKAALAGFGFLTSFAMNPGQVAPVVGLAQRAVGLAESKLLGTSKISDGFAALRDIPVMQANMANRAARSFSYDMKDLSKEEKDNLDAVFSLQQFSDATGRGSIANNPNATIGITSRGEAVVSYSKGSLAANYNARGDIIGDRVVRSLTPQEVKEAMEKGLSFVTNARNAADPSYSPSKVDPAIGKGMGGGPQTAAEAVGVHAATAAIAATMAPSFGTDDTEDDEDANETTDQIDTFSDISTVNTVSNNNNASGGDNGGSGGGGGGGGGVGGGTGTGTSSTAGHQGGVESFEGYGGDSGGMGGTGNAAADTGAESPEGNNSAPGDFKYGGFVKKRNTQKKKKRRGLAGR